MTTLTQTTLASHSNKPMLVNGAFQDVVHADKHPYARVVAKDLFIEATEALDADTNPGEKIALQAATHPSHGAWSFTEEDNFSVISQILLMTTLLANADTSAYLTQAKMANENSNYAACLAPLIKKMVLQNWSNQAASTRCDAEKAKTAGIGGLIAGTVGIGMGAWAHYGEVTKDAAKVAMQETTSGATTARPPVASATASATRSPSGALGAGEAAVTAGSRTAPATAVAEATGTSLKKGASKIAKGLSKMAKAGQIIGKVMMAIQSVHVMTEGGTKLAGDMKYDFEKAGYQEKIGAADAAEKQTSALQGVATSAGQRMNEAAGQSQKGHGEALGALQRVSSDLSQAVCAVLRA